jgi:hypothetical protein
MSEGFMALSAPLGIAGSSYMVQLGKVNALWAVRLVKGNDVLDSKVFRDKGADDIPNANEVVGWILQVLPIPNLNPYQISKTVGFIRQEAIRRNEDNKVKAVASLDEAKAVKLEAVPEEAKNIRQKTVGWVKEDEKPAEEPALKAESAAPKAAASSAGSESGQAGGEEVKAKPKRQLAAIPMGEGAAQPVSQPASQHAAQPAAQASAVQPSNVQGEAVQAASQQHLTAKSKEEGVYTIRVPKGTKRIILEFD